MYLVLRWFINALALLGVAYLVPGVEVASFYVALVVALILGFVNTVIRPILFILTLPITLLTIGLFSFVLNAFLFWFVASFIDGFNVNSPLAAFLGPIVLSIFSWLGSRFLKGITKKDKED